MPVNVTYQDLGTYLGIAVDPTRGQFLCDKATALCLSVLSPLPDGAETVVLDVAARAYGNPNNVQQQSAGPFNVAYGPVGGGMWLTRANKATLRRLGGGGGAFTIDTMPPNAGQKLPPWDVGTPGPIGDWDTPP